MLPREVLLGVGQLIGPDTLALMIPIVGIMIPIVAILTKHQQRMAEIIHSQHGGNEVLSKLESQERELQLLREQLNTQAIQIDDLKSRPRLTGGVQTIEDRLNAQ